MEGGVEPKTSSHLSATADVSSEIAPSEYRLDPPFPNPFNPSTQIRFALPTDSRVRLTVFDALGREVSTLVNDICAVGYHTVTWDSQSGGKPVSSGIYFARIQVTAVNNEGTYSKLVKLLLLK